MNNKYKKKKTPEEFHIFIILFAFTGIRTDLPTEFLPNPNRDVNHYATEHLYIRGTLKYISASFLTSNVLDIS